MQKCRAPSLPTPPHPTPYSRSPRLHHSTTPSLHHFRYIGRDTTNSAIVSSARRAAVSGRSSRALRALSTRWRARSRAYCSDLLGRIRLRIRSALSGVGAGQQRAEQRLVLLRGRPQEVDQRQGHLPLLGVDAERLADGPDVADEVEDVVLDLERRARSTGRSIRAACDLRLVRPGEPRPQLAAGRAQAGGLAVDDLDVGLLVEVEVVAVVDLEQFALANDRWSSARSSGWRAAIRGWSRGGSCG